MPIMERYTSENPRFFKGRNGKSSSLHEMLMRRIVIHMADNILLFTDIWTPGVIQVKDRCSIVFNGVQVIIFLDFLKIP